ncbi:hypothetical protein Ait01nite_077470 [Actinoplanes italicus]|uniref:Lipoprotein n=1 Tax=Actinoplanes italicus TaxID=113567 RepID=A0A2T0K411_9ACTN|nr:hypothetical protein [Actinoplanes italicus]PRX17615.1 hypothetical protein CLV67_115118 [Actinoplanes italicus]GIE34702.1 hypothetical protein Ait01nite_077470 [Actinoplanes italicus]
MKLVRGILAGILVAATATGLIACGPIGVQDSRLVEAGGASKSALDGHVRFSVPAGGGTGDIRVRFVRGPLPADRPIPAGIVTVGDMVSMEAHGDVERGRITIDYHELPAGVLPEMLNLFGWSGDLGGWVPLPGTITDTVDRSISGETILFDSFVIGTWHVTTDAVGDSITTGTGTLVPVKTGTNRGFWPYARAAAVSSLADTLEHLTGPPEDLSCEPRATGTTAAVASVPGGRFDACVLAGTGSRQIRVRNRFPFPMILQLPPDGRVRPVVDTEVTAFSPDLLDGVRDTVLTYLAGSVAVGGGQTVTLELQPGKPGPIRLTGHLDWSVIALDAGLRQLDLLLPGSRALRPDAAEALLQAYTEHGAAARPGLAAGDLTDPAVQSLLSAAGLTGSGRAVADVFAFGSCVLKRTDTIAGADQDVLSSARTTGPTVASFTADCLNTIYDKYLPPGSRSAQSILDTLRGATGTVRQAIPKADRKRGFGQVTVTVTVA